MPSNHYRRIKQKNKKVQVKLVQEEERYDITRRTK